MSRLGQFIACLGWVFVAIDRIANGVPTSLPMWVWWVIGGIWMLTGLLAFALPRRA